MMSAALFPKPTQAKLTRSFGLAKLTFPNTLLDSITAPAAITDCLTKLLRDK